jgi:hypothetical protein
VSEGPSGNRTNEIHVLLERMKNQLAVSFALSVVLLAGVGGATQSS